MPNHVTNAVHIYGPENVLECIKERMASIELDFDGDEKVNHFDFKALVPPPEGYDEEDCSLDNKNPLNWYHWNRANWGTKWNSYSQAEPIIENGCLTFRFDTAWAHPEPVIEKLAAEYPDLIIRHMYIDEAPNYAGEDLYQDGELVENKYMDAHSCNLGGDHLKCQRYIDLHIQLYNEMPTDWVMEDMEW